MSISEDEVLGMQLQLEQQQRQIEELYALLRRTSGTDGTNTFTTQTLTVVTSVSCNNGQVTGTTQQIRVLASEE